MHERPADSWSTTERRDLRQLARSFAEREILPNIDEWERAGELPRELSKKAGAAGLMGIGYPEPFGTGDEVDSFVVTEEMIFAGVPLGVMASLMTWGYRPRTSCAPATSGRSTSSSLPR